MNRCKRMISQQMILKEVIVAGVRASSGSRMRLSARQSHRTNSSALHSRCVFVLFVLAFLATETNSQTDRFAEEWRWIEFNTTSGLPSNHVLEIIETEDETPWVLTKSGIAWYDTYIWHPVTLPIPTPISNPQSFYSGANGKIVVVHDSSLFEGDTSGFRKVDISGVDGAVPLPDGRLLVVQRQEGNRQRLGVWNGSKLVPINPPEQLEAKSSMRILRTRSGTIWLGSGKCWFAYASGTWKRMLCVENAGETWWPEALAENPSRTGIFFGYGVDRSLVLWEWTEGKTAVPNRMFSWDRIISSDISDFGSVLMAGLGGYYRFKSQGLWSTFHIQRLWARRIEMLRFRRNGDVWFCTDRGLWLFRYSCERWEYISGNAPWPHGSVNQIFLAPDSSLWLATDIGVRVVTKNGKATLISNILGQDVHAVTSMIEVDDGSILISSGSAFTGLFRWRQSKWERISQGTPLENARIHRMKKDRSGRIWLLGIAGVNALPHEEGPGAFVYENGLFTRWSLPSNRVYSFEESNDGSYWFGTFAGMSRWKSGSWKHWTRKELFGVEKVFTLAFDKDGQVWFSDRRSVVGIITPSDSVQRITTEDGLINEQVWEIKVDHKGRVWCTTPAGLGVYSEGQWTHIDEELGLRNAPLWPILPLENDVYIGSMTGLSVLRLSSIDQSAPRLFLDKPLTTENIALLRWRAFVPWSSVPHAHISTRYRVDSGPWSSWSQSREADVQNISAGEHVYEVQSKPMFGKDTTSYETARGSFHIRVPLTKDPRVMVPAAVAVALILTLIVVSTTHARRLKARQLRDELRREQEHARRLTEVNTFKSRFLGNISHELRTPLTLVLGPIQQVLSRDKDEWSRERLAMALRNAEKLHGLMNQLLDFSKIEAGTLKLAVTRGNVVLFVQQIVHSFASWADQSGITLTLETNKKEIEGYFDADALEKILNNLLSNALKFTPDRGTIRVSVRESETAPRRIIMGVVDSGIGIAQEHLPHIFERFYQVDESHKHQGTGIGLALTKELVELHHGSITVESTIGKGATFTLSLPLESYATGEMLQSANPGQERNLDADASEDAERDDEDAEQSEAIRKTIVLLVEDSADLRAYVRDYLISEYTVVEADNGANAWERAQELIPDLVISDVMMPRLNGYELCKKLKQDERTSHVPVILLTARSRIEDKLEGLELGADDYLSKPFDATELLIRTRNLIDGRRKLREIFSRAVVLKPGEVTISPLEDSFLRKATQTVQERMGDETFNVDQFSNEMTMSRMQLHRKLRALTGSTTSEFIRHLRLQRANELLSKRAGTVSEIAYQTGFSSLAYFTNCYRKHFGCTPTETRELNSRTNNTTG